MLFIEIICQNSSIIHSQLITHHITHNSKDTKIRINYCIKKTTP